MLTLGIKSLQGVFPPLAMFKERVVITENRQLTRSFYQMSFRSRKMAERAQPGHFVQIRVSNSFDPFLPRPMSICRVRGDLLDILYIVIGRGSKVMAETKVGSELEAWGPLGTIFTPERDRRVICVGGGVGIAPLIFLASKLRVEEFLFGVRSKDDLLPARELGVEESRIHISSNDGSVGTKGYVTEIFDAMIEKVKSQDCFVYTCGPNPMLEKVVKSAKAKRISGEASLEEQMACGVGACLGCVMDTHKGRITLCKEGPVLPFEVLPW